MTRTIALRRAKEWLGRRYCFHKERYVPKRVAQEPKPTKLEFSIPASIRK